MRQRASPSAPCQTPQSLLHKSCIYPATQSTVFKPLIPSAIVAPRGSHPSTWLWMRFFFFNQMQTKYEQSGGQYKVETRRKRSAPQVRLDRENDPLGPLVKSRLEWLALSPDEHAPMSMPAPAEMADNQSVVVKHGAVTGQRSLPSGPQRVHAHALIHLLSGLSSQWTHYCVKPQGWYWIQIHYRLEVNCASVDNRTSTTTQSACYIKCI